MAGAVRAAIFCPTTVEPVNETMRTWVVVGSSINTLASLGLGDAEDCEDGGFFCALEMSLMTTTFCCC